MQHCAATLCRNIVAFTFTRKHRPATLLRHIQNVSDVPGEMLQGNCNISIVPGNIISLPQQSCKYLYMVQHWYFFVPAHCCDTMLRHNVASCKWFLAQKHLKCSWEHSFCAWKYQYLCLGTSFLCRNNVASLFLPCKRKCNTGHNVAAQCCGTKLHRLNPPLGIENFCIFVKCYC